MEKRIDEGEIKGAIESITMKQTEKILNQMNKSICKILGKEKNGTGFFCQLDINNEKIPVLITNFHIIDDKFIQSSNKIKFQKVNDKVPKIINLNKNKKIYSSPNENYDIMIIKLDKEDEIEDIQYLEIDDSLLLDKSERVYEDKSLYILHFPFGDELRVSYGKGSTKENDFNIIHKCETNKGSSGSPIFNLSTNKVIGIHKSYVSKANGCVNLGTFLKDPIKDLKSLFHKKIKKRQSNLNTNNKQLLKKVEPKVNAKKIIINNNICNSKLRGSDLNNKYRKIDNKQYLKTDINEDNAIYKRDEKKMNTNQDNFHKKISKTNLGENNLNYNYKKINDQQSLNIHYNINKKDNIKMNTNQDNLQKNSTNSYIGVKDSPTKYRKIRQHENIRINNYIMKNIMKNDNKIENVKKILYGEIERKYLNNTEPDIYNSNNNNNYKNYINNYNEYQRYNANNINNNITNNGEEEHNENNINANKLNGYTNFKKELIYKNEISEDSHVKNAFNKNKRSTPRYLYSDNKNYRHNTYRNLKNSFINYNNLNQNGQFQVSNYSINQIYKNKNSRNYEVNVSVEKSPELIFDKEKTNEKYISNKKLITTPNLSRRDNSRNTKSLFSIKIKGLFKN